MGIRRIIFLLGLFLIPFFVSAKELCDLENKLLVSKETLNEQGVDSALDFLNETIEDCYQETKGLADLLRERGDVLGLKDRDQEAIEDFEKALEIVRTKDIDLIREGNYLQALGNAYSGLGKYSLGEEFLNKSISILERLDPNGESIVYAYSKMGMNLNQQGKYTEASKFYTKGLQLSEIFFGAGSPDHAILLSNQAINYNKQSKYKLAEIALRKSLSIFENFPLSRQLNIAITSNNLSSNLTNQGRYEEAQLYIESAIEMIKLATPGDSMNLGIFQYNLAHNFRKQYKQNESQKYFILANELVEKILGPDHPTTAITKQGLAINYREQGRISDSIELNKQIHAIYKKNFDTNSNRMADLYTFLSQDAIDQEDFDQAEFFFLETIRISTLNRGRSTTDVSLALSRYAEFLDSQGRFEESEKIHKEALKIIEKINEGSIGHFARLHYLSVHYSKRGLFVEALNTELQAYEVLKKQRLGEIGSMKAETLAFLSLYFGSTEDLASALDYAEQADYEFEQYLLRNKAETPINEMNIFKQVKKHSVNHINFLIKEGSQKSNYKTFKLAQIASVSPVSFAIKRNRQRDLSDDGSSIIKQHQDLIESRRLLQKKLDHLYLNSSTNNKEIIKLTRERGSIEVLISRVGKQVKKTNPDYSESIFPTSHGVRKVQSKLDPSSLVIKYLELEDQVLVWAISKNDFFNYSIDTKEKKLQEKIDIVREANLNYRQKLEDYPFQESYFLYKELIYPSLEKFNDINKILIVPSQGLNLISFQSLINLETDSFELSEIPWLIKTFPITILPSVSSLFNLKYQPLGKSFNSFVGIGNPILEGKLDTSDLIVRRGGLEVEEVRSLALLPESQQELEKISQFIDKEERLLLTGDKATKRNVYSLQLEDVDLISFATHAVNANLGYGIEEPALVLSGSGSNKLIDWLLTTSEIRSLDLNASLVILSACNTASISSGGQSAYSGLAESFFYAGANSVLVSQWPVDSYSTVELTTNMLLNFKENNSLTMSQALQRSMLSLMQSNDTYQHPFYWAPFVLVGAN